MSRKKTIFIIIAVTIIALILTWLWLQNVIEKYDIDRAIDSTNQMLTRMENMKSWFNFI